MLTVNIHKAKTHLSRLVERAAEGEPFVIAKAGKPLVKVTALDAPAGGRKPGSAACRGARLARGCAELARISQRGRCIGTLDLRKSN
jgi:prevent-host-death family protein